MVKPAITQSATSSKYKLINCFNIQVNYIWQLFTVDTNDGLGAPQCMPSLPLPKPCWPKRLIAPLPGRVKRDSWLSYQHQLATPARKRSRDPENEQSLRKRRNTAIILLNTWSHLLLLCLLHHHQPHVVVLPLLVESAADLVDGSSCGLLTLPKRTSWIFKLIWKNC